MNTLHETTAPFLPDDFVGTATPQDLELRLMRNLAERRDPQIKVVKQPESAIIPDRKVQLLRKIGNAQAEIGRLNKLLDEIRAEVLTTL